MTGSNYSRIRVTSRKLGSIVASHTKGSYKKSKEKT
jgi:hypothetical protein